MAMRIKVEGGDWRTMMRVCGGVAKTSLPEAILTKYLDLHIANNEIMAYGSNGSQIARVSFPCVMDDSSACFTLMVSPEKVIAGTKRVELFVDFENEVYDIVYIDDVDDILDSTHHGFFDGIPINYEQHIFDAFQRVHHHTMVINPKHLLTALQGLKDAEYVIMDFGDTSQPFLLRPYDYDADVVELVSPQRPIK